VLQRAVLFPLLCSKQAAAAPPPLQLLQPLLLLQLIPDIAL
jgi:hypothetical protein